MQKKWNRVNQLDLDFKGQIEGDDELSNQVLKPLRKAKAKKKSKNKDKRAKAVGNSAGLVKKRKRSKNKLATLEEESEEEKFSRRGNEQRGIFNK